MPDLCTITTKCPSLSIYEHTWPILWELAFALNLLFIILTMLKDAQLSDNDVNKNTCINIFETLTKCC